MTSVSRGGVSSVKKAAATAEAPIWKSYLAIRSSSADVATDQVNKSSINGNLRGRKRAKPSAIRGAHGSGAGTWITLATPLTTTQSAAVLKSIRHYWQQLTVNERQQILFLDEPELVKQLYKLNLSLLCVGLMQRHLKTSNRTATDTAAANKKVAATTTSVSKVSTNVSVVQERATTQQVTRAVTDTMSEKTYELLEAMEFMDIGTGILTVKTELAEDTDRLFTLVGDVLAGFLTSIHVLTESNFNKLFVTESETINTWADYQRLIAMLVEQLILRSYISHLEKEAALQMEQLLLEVSLEDTGQSIGNPASHNRKKCKKKKKKKPVAATVQQVVKSEVMKHELKDEPAADICDDTLLNHDESPNSEEPTPEPIPESKSIPLDSDCQSNSSTAQTDEGTLDADEAMSAEVKPSSKKVSGLNPNALIFLPQEHVLPVEDVGARNPFAGKRKFDEYIINVPWEDVESDTGNTFDIRSVGGDWSDREDEFDEIDAQQRWRRKQRRREEDAELEWQLQQVYATTSSLFGWDFSRQCELPDPGANLQWSESTLWRTAPKEVVRYFSPGNGDAYSRFHAPHFLPPAAGFPLSRYYFNPGPPMPFVPGIESLPSFSFQPPEFPMVVSSPDFSNAQYHPSNHEEEMDV